jgi:cytochrome c-type biogenesis protein CcmH
VIVILLTMLAAAEDDAFEGVGAPPLAEPLDSAPLIEERTDGLAEILRCPVCQGMSVADSREGASLAMRERIREMVAAGYTDEQVIDYFVDRYGEGIVLLPDNRHVLIWIGPLLALLVGSAMVVMRIRQRSQPQGAGGAPLSRAGAQPSPVPEIDRHRAAILAELED